MTENNPQTYAAPEAADSTAPAAPADPAAHDDQTEQAAAPATEAPPADAVPDTTVADAAPAETQTPDPAPADAAPLTSHTLVIPHVGPESNRQGFVYRGDNEQVVLAACSIDTEVWRAMGSPDHLTVTFAPGDQLNTDQNQEPTA